MSRSLSARLDPPASDPVFTAKDLTTITALFPSSCSPSGSSSPSSTSLSFPPFPRPFAAFALCSRLGLGLCRRFRWKLTLLVVCWDPWPSSPQLCDLTCRMAAFHRLWAFTSFVPSLPQLWQVRASEPCFGLVATCTLLSRSLVSLIRVWYATTDSQTLTLPRSYSPEGGRYYCKLAANNLLFLLLYSPFCIWQILFVLSCIPEQELVRGLLCCRSATTFKKRV